MTIINRLKAKAELIGILKEELRKEALENLEQLVEFSLSQLDQKFNEVKWVAYTPYFNDGEPCLFRNETYVYGLEDEPDLFFDMSWINPYEEDMRITAKRSKEDPTKWDIKYELEGFNHD